MPKKILLTVWLSLVIPISQAETINEARAKFNYQLFCMGCHVPDGSGGPHVPSLKGFVGYFLNSSEGREYLVRVPGSANAKLDDKKLAEVLNWIVLEFGEASIPDTMQYYTAEEVGKLRQDPLLEVVNYRKQLLSAMDYEP